MRIRDVFFFVSQILDFRVSIFLEDVDIVCLMQFQFCIDCIVRLLSFCAAFFLYAFPFGIFIFTFMDISFFLVLYIILAFLVIMEIYRFFVYRLKILIIVKTQHFEFVIFLLLISFFILILLILFIVLGFDLQESWFQSLIPPYESYFVQIYPPKIISFVEEVLNSKRERGIGVYKCSVWVKYVH